MEPINLDCLNDDDLSAVISYGRYAEMRKSAMSLRAAGEVELALQEERQMEILYKDMPVKYRW